ncbi:MAG: DNA internalization-related competence protein ComEC/Rec2 [Endomicrobiales bacterium]
MRVLSLIKKRPLIVLTLCYACLLIALDQSGFFARPRPPYVPAEEAEIRAAVLDAPETREGRARFPVRILSVNGQATDGKALVTGYGPQGNVAPGDVLLIEGAVKEAPGDRNPGGFDYAAYLGRQGISALVYASSIEAAGSNDLPFYRAIAFRIRKNILDTLSSSLPATEAGVLAPMLVGEKSGLSGEMKAAFTDAGVMHVLVVSGLNVAYCSALFLWLFRFCGLSRRRAALLSIPFILLYMLITGANPPVVRASVMALFVILSLALAREPLIYQSLGLAALVILVFDPQALFTPSFQLSFAATIGIVYLSPILMKPFAWLPAWIRYPVGGTFAVSLAAQLAVIPLTAYYFNKISLAGILSNLVIVPLVGLITLAGFFLYAAHFISPLLTHLASGAAYFLLHLLLALVSFFSQLPASTLHVATPPAFFIALYYGALWGVFGLGRFAAAPWLAAGSLAAFSLSAFISFYAAKDTLRVSFLDVGNADAIHLRFPDGRHWLIDAGGGLSSAEETGRRVVCPYLWSRGVRRLDKVVLTHPHYPHYGGLEPVLENFPVGEVVVNPDVSTEPEFVRFCETAKDRKIPLRETWAGDVFVVGNSTVSVLWPAVLSSRKDENCLVLLLEYCGKRVLLTSDLGEEAERSLLASGQDLAASALVLPNHGRNTVSEKFISAVNPAVFVLSGRKTRAPRAAETAGGEVFSTGACGTVTLALDNKTMRVKGLRDR